MFFMSAASASLALAQIVNQEMIKPSEFQKWEMREEQILGRAYTLYVADTQAKRAHGLMHVTSMDRDEGVLFVFPKNDRYCMWMKNTHLPLRLFWIDDQGNVLQQDRLTPHDETPICSKHRVRFAVEILD